MALRPGSEFLGGHPTLATTLVVALSLVLLAMLAKTVQLRRDRRAYLATAERLAAIRPDFSVAYARGFLALGWLADVGFLVLFGLGLWVDLFGGSYAGKTWVLVTWQSLLWAGMILPYFYWPRWAMPAHAKDDVSPFQQRRQRRRERSALRSS